MIELFSGMSARQFAKLVRRLRSEAPTPRSRAVPGSSASNHIVEQNLLNGLFQTEDHVEGLNANRPGVKGGPDNGLRIERQDAVHDRSNPPEIVHITDEAALRREVGGLEVMRAQIRHLLESNERDNVEFLVMPFAAPIEEFIDASNLLA